MPFSPVKANMDLTEIEFVHIFENDITLVNSQIRKKIVFLFYFFFWSGSESLPLQFFFFLLEK